MQMTAQASAGPATSLGLAAMKDSAGSHSSPSLPLPTRFDPANFGTALINAARDAGDRFAAGSPHLGVNARDGTATTSLASRTTSPPPTGGEGDRDGAPSLNENLRNLGKFFRRGDGPGFGGFGKRDG